MTESSQAEFGGAPQAESSTAKESEIKHHVTPAVSRLLTAATAINIERFNPEHTSELTQDETQDLLQMEPEEIFYEVMEDVSMDSRKKVGEKYDPWKTRTENWTKGQLAKTDDLSSERIAALKAIGLINETGEQGDAAFTIDVENFHANYLDKQSDIFGFIEDLAKGCTDENGVINMQHLQKRISSIEPLLKVFGTDNNINLMVRDLAISYGMLSQTEETKNTFIPEINKGVTTPIPADAPERQYLTALYEKVKPKTTPTEELPNTKKEIETTGETPPITSNDESLLDILLNPELGDNLYDELVGKIPRGERKPWDPEEQKKAQAGMLEVFTTEFDGFPELSKGKTLEEARAIAKAAVTGSDPNLQAELQKAQQYPHRRNIKYQDNRDLYSEGDFLFFGGNFINPAASDALPGDLRIYVTPTNSAVGKVAAEVIRLAREHNVEPHGKVIDESSRNKLSERKDRILFWVRTANEQKIIMDSLREIAGKHPDLFEENPPLLTEKTDIKGVGIAEDPTDGSSYNATREKLLKEAWSATLIKLKGPEGQVVQIPFMGGFQIKDKRIVDLQEGLEKGSIQKEAVIAELRHVIRDLCPKYNVDPNRFAFNIHEGTTPPPPEAPKTTSQAPRSGDIITLENQQFMASRVENDIVHGVILSDEPPISRTMDSWIDYIKTHYQESQPTETETTTPKGDTPSNPIDIGLGGLAGAVAIMKEPLRLKNERVQEAQKLLRSYGTTYMPSVLANIVTKYFNTPLEELLPIPGGTLKTREDKSYVITGISIDQDRDKANDTFILNGPVTEQTLSLDEFLQRREDKFNENFTRAELDAIITSESYSPQELINFFKRRYKKDYEATTYVREGYTLEQHTLMALNQFEKYFANKAMPEPMTKDFFRVFIALHDIGKPASGVDDNDTSDQHEYTVPMMKDILTNLDFTENQQKLAIALIDGDALGDTIAHPENLDKNVAEIKQKAAQAGVTPQQFFNILKLYFNVDGGSYTEDAGGDPAFDRRYFVFTNTETEHKMEFTPEKQAIVDRMESAINSDTLPKTTPELGPDAREFAIFIRDHFTQLQEKIDGPNGTLTELKRKLANHEITLNPNFETIISRVNEQDLKEYGITRDDLRAIFASFGNGQERSALQDITLIKQLDITPGQEMAKDGEGRDIRLSADPKNLGEWIPPLGRFEGDNELRLYLPRLKENYPDERTRRIAALWVAAHEFTHSLVDTSHMAAGVQGQNIELPNGQQTTTGELLRDRIIPALPALPTSSRTASLRNSDGTLPTEPNRLNKIVTEEICESAAADILGFAQRPDQTANTTLQDPFVDRQDFHQAVIDFLRAKKV